MIINVKYFSEWLGVFVDNIVVIESNGAVDLETGGAKTLEMICGDTEVHLESYIIFKGDRYSISLDFEDDMFYVDELEKLRSAVEKELLMKDVNEEDIVGASL